MVRQIVPSRFTPAVGRPRKPHAATLANRSALAPSAGSSYATDLTLDAQDKWQAHIDAGRIAVR